jgi:peptide/nickel transport system permease protein
MAKNLGLDQPLPVQYAHWMNNFLHGDFGHSFTDLSDVRADIRVRLVNTLVLSGIALILSALISIPLGVISAVKKDSALDRFITGISFLGISIPVFWLGVMLMVLFSVKWGLLPAGGMFTIGSGFSLIDRIEHLILPVFTLCVFNLAALTRYTRSSMIGVLQEDYVRTARAKGLRSPIVIYRHALRNALIPVVTILGTFLPSAVAGAAVTETVFSWPGMGLFAVQATTNKDYPVILAVTMVVAIVVVISNLLTDIAYGFLDPRVRLG